MPLNIYTDRGWGRGGRKVQRAIGAKAKTNEVWEGEVEEKNKKMRTKSR